MTFYCIFGSDTELERMKLVLNFTSENLAFASLTTFLLEYNCFAKLC